MFFPGFHHLFIFSEHSFAGTWCIDQNLVKIFRKILFNFTWLLTEHKHIADAEHFNIF